MDYFTKEEAQSILNMINKVMIPVLNAEEVSVIIKKLKDIIDAPEKTGVTTSNSEGEQH